MKKELDATEVVLMDVALLLGIGAAACFGWWNDGAWSLLMLTLGSIGLAIAAAANEMDSISTEDTPAWAGLHTFGIFITGLAMVGMFMTDLTSHPTGWYVGYLIWGFCGPGYSMCLWLKTLN